MATQFYTLKKEIQAIIDNKDLCEQKKILAIEDISSEYNDDWAFGDEGIAKEVRESNGSAADYGSACLFCYVISTEHGKLVQYGGLARAREEMGEANAEHVFWLMSKEATALEV